MIQQLKPASLYHGISHGKHLYSDGEFVKKNIAEVIVVLDPNNRKLQRLISQTPVSRHTVKRRISRISANVKDKLRRDLENATAFSLALDESTDVTNNPQLAVFVRYVFSDVVLKELLDLTLFSSTAGLLKPGPCKNVCNYFIFLDKILEFLDFS